uniref:C2H2-type domain-containing protein n=1 Tax=Setaria italica TaxID=4555 RepID=K3ZZ60_SETIT
TAAADGGGVSDGRRFRDPPSHGDSMLVIRDALQAQLQKDRLRQEIIEAELAKIDRAMALRPATLNCISDVQQGKPVSCSLIEEFMTHRGFLGAGHDLKKKDERHGSLEMKPWNPVMGMGYRLGECSTDGKAGQESKMQESNEVEATSEHNLQEHFAGQKHQANVASLESRNNGGRQQTAIRALQQEESKSTAMDYVYVRPPSAGGKLPLNGSRSNVASSVMARHMMSLYFCKVCNVQCSSEVMFEDHLRGKKHRGKMRKLKVRTFCKVCNLQCHSDEMLADHLAGKKHQKKARVMGLI